VTSNCQGTYRIYISVPLLFYSRGLVDCDTAFPICFSRLWEFTESTIMAFCKRKDQRQTNLQSSWSLHTESTNLKIFPGVRPQYDGLKRQLPVRLPGRPEAAYPTPTLPYPTPPPPSLVLCVARLVLPCRASQRSVSEFRFGYDESCNYLLRRDARSSCRCATTDKCAVENNTPVNNTPWSVLHKIN